jgi:predicted outer membrane repeat protein
MKHRTTNLSKYSFIAGAIIPGWLARLLFCLVFLAARFSQAATITIISTADSGPGSLRAALTSAADGDTIDATGVSGTILLTNGELFISKSVAILGPGAGSLAVDGNAASRVFHTSSNTVVTISGLTITNGRAAGLSFPAVAGGAIYNDQANLTLTHCNVSGNTAAALADTSSAGGGVFSRSGANGNATLTVLDCTFVGNSAMPGTVENAGGVGGAIDNFALSRSTATLTVSNCSFTANSAPTGAGGAIFSTAVPGPANISIMDSTFLGNTAGDGGAIFNAEDAGNSLMQITGSSFSTNSSVNGGAIYNIAGPQGTAALIISNSTIIGNSATEGGGIANDSQFSGNGDAPLTVVNCLLAANSSTDGGGLAVGISGRGGSNSPVTITNTHIIGNSASETAGGINVNWNSPVTLQNCVVSGNSAANGSGGGIYNTRNNFTLNACTISGNSATNAFGGGIYNDSGGDAYVGAMMVINASTVCSNSAGAAAAIYNDGRFGTVLLFLENSTLSGNTAAGGGGIWNDGDSFDTYSYAFLGIDGSTLNNNSDPGIWNISSPFLLTAELYIGSSIVNAGISGTTLSSSFADAGSDGFNLFSDGFGGFALGPGDQVFTDPLLGPLQDNGGPTFTHAPLPGSPAIDKGKNRFAVPTDQRGQGFVRTFDNLLIANADGGDGTDIGAFEVQHPSSNQPPVAVCRDVTVYADPDCTAYALIDVGSYDPDGDPITLTQSPPNPYPVGTNIVTLTVVDSRGASNSCTARVIVTDTSSPTLTCPSNITVYAYDAGGAYITFADPIANSCAGPPKITFHPPSGSGFPIGTSTVTCTATDRANGNYVSCQFQVTVLGLRDIVRHLLDMVNSQCPRPQPLRVSLNAALDSIDRNNSAAAVSQLQAFQTKVLAQVAPSDPTLAATLSQFAQNAINILNSAR